jgi:heme exporter protein A
MLTLDNLTYYIDNKLIFKNIGLSISTTSALIIKGDNGSGKTSLLRLICGLDKSYDGKILWGKNNVENMRHDFNADLQYIGHNNFLKQHLTIEQNLKFFSKLYDCELALESALSFFEILDQRNIIIKKLSAGIQKKVMLAKLLACPSTIWILDEPLVNLDKKFQDKLLNLIKTRIKEGGLVIIATHNDIFDKLGPTININDFKNDK